MATIELDSSLVDLVKSELQLKNLEIVLNSNWGSKNIGYREAIHGDLKKKMSKAFPLSDSSISHSPEFGGYVFSKMDMQDIFQIGFDLELSSRVNQAIADRIKTSEDQILDKVSPVSIWTAKEAAFKALKGPQQPKVISSISIGNWIQHTSFQIETCSVLNVSLFNFSNVKGLIFPHQNHHLSLFVARP